MLTARVFVLALPGDSSPHAAAEEVRSALAAARANAPERAEEPPDAAVIVLGEDADRERLAALAPGLTGRAVALVGSHTEPVEARAALEHARNTLRDAKVTVVARQLTLTPDALSVYGFTDDTHREKLASVVALLLHEADKLKARRDGWEEPAQ